MPGIKRKSIGGGGGGGSGQSIISKFFKSSGGPAKKKNEEDGTSSPRRKKKIPLIHVLDADVIAPSQSSSLLTSSENNVGKQQISTIPNDGKDDVIVVGDNNVGNLSNKATDAKTATRNISRRVMEPISTTSTLLNSAVTIRQQSLDKLARFSKNFSGDAATTNISKQNKTGLLDHYSKVNSWDFRTNKGATTEKKSGVSSIVVDKDPPKTHPLKTPQTPQLKQAPPSYTPLEKQVLELRKRSHGALLFVECGYKYRFFGNDAEIAAKELNIYCHMDHNFMTASIPVHRLNVHLERLIEKGYKVGVVKQNETAALKANSANKSAPFTRSIANIYTKATLIDRQDSTNNIGSNNEGEREGSYILAINSSSSLLSNNNTINFVAVNPTTSDVIFHQCRVSDVGVAVETVLTCLEPCELVLPTANENSAENKHEFVESIVSNYVKNKASGVYVERLGEISSFGAVEIDNLKSLDSKLDAESLLSCVRQLALYLVQFNMEGILRSKKNFRAFHIPAQSLVLDGITLRNLEIFTNNTDGGVRGSLFAVVDHACTPFGRRLLRRWISNPLVCKAKIERRLDAVTELVDGWKSDFVKATRKGLAGCPDIENGLTIVALGKATPSKFVRTVAQLDKLRRLFLKYRDDVSLKFNTSSVLLVDIFEQVSSFLSDSRLEDALLRLNRTEAERDNKAALFNVSLENRDAYADVFCAKDEIASLEVELEGYRTSRLPKLLGKFTVEYKCVSGLEYLVEVKNKELGGVPSDWIKITATKQVTRFRPPLVDVTFKKLCRAREKLTLASNDAWTHFLKEFSDQHYESCKCAVEHISSFDCLMSLAVVAKQPGYCRPRFTEGKCIYIKDGRHPVIEGLLTNGEQYVANDTSLDHKRKVMLISGPNMGGKSSYIKQIAINCLLAQSGSYVAATSATLGVLDGIYTRMGANDNIACGKSTFMLEMEEAARILKNATSRSLVILDELGRGTSTFDGMAIAYATLKYFSDECGSLTLFVSHYPSIFKEYENHSTCSNYHMSFIAHACDQEEQVEEHHKKSIVFLYKVVEGIAGGSYGLNVARLAGIDCAVIGNASRNSKRFADNVKAIKLFCSLLRFSSTNDNASMARLMECLGEN